jgi:hypothetical protein
MIRSVLRLPQTHEVFISWPRGPGPSDSAVQKRLLNRRSMLSHAQAWFLTPRHPSLGCGDPRKCGAEWRDLSGSTFSVPRKIFAPRRRTDEQRGDASASGRFPCEYRWAGTWGGFRLQETNEELSVGCPSHRLQSAS